MVGKVSILGFAAGLIASSVSAQGPGPRAGAGPLDFVMLRAEFGIANKVVTGAPYSAQAVTQFTQTLQNGDHIQRTTTATVSRDSQGRTRVERSLANTGALPAARRGRALAIVINDPVAGMSYGLDPVSHTARAMPIRAGRSAFIARNQASIKTEDLGTQVIQGVSAQGKRTTRVIPAGAEGNEKEIDIVTETWFSPDLQVIVMSKTSDPRFGDSVYQLNSISRTEPDPALFVVPPDYTVREGRPLMRRRGPAGQ